ncbi:hypothetical protein EV424DRAFT_1543028 [Suillus variegatus]|nr:hypothetical protein EV424DRAFT_1543028 [Suillus variegatus]
MHPILSSANTKGAGSQDMNIDDHGSNHSSLVLPAQEEDYDMNADALRLSSPPLPGQVDGGIGDACHLSVPPAPEVGTEFYGMGKKLYHNYHAGLNAQPCDANGLFSPPGTPPLPLTEQLPDDWSPFCNRTEFETAEFLYSRTQMSTPNINTLLDL